MGKLGDAARDAARGRGEVPAASSTPLSRECWKKITGEDSTMGFKEVGEAIICMVEKRATQSATNSKAQQDAGDLALLRRLLPAEFHAQAEDSGAVPTLCFPGCNVIIFIVC